MRTSCAPPEWIEADLAPGDIGDRARALAASGLRIERIRSAEHPLFQMAYDRLWDEFGASGELERRAVLASRFRWNPVTPQGEHALLYEMIAVLRGDAIVGLRDHTAMLPLEAIGGPRSSGTSRSVLDPADRVPAAPVVVHLSHTLVEPELRGSGLAGWLRAFPIQAARECARRAGLRADHPITLVAEMEALDPSDPASVARLRSYARAGFRMIAPNRVAYHQPDFREASEIERTGVESIPLRLVVRRVAREADPTIPPSEARALIEGLYAMFSAHVRADHMAPLERVFDSLADDAHPIPLEEPTQP